MKLATLRTGDARRRDGRLVVVSRDLSRMLDAEAVAPTLQAALDDWSAGHEGWYRRAMLRWLLPFAALSLAACHLALGLDDYTKGAAVSAASTSRPRWRW